MNFCPYCLYLWTVLAETWRGRSPRNVCVRGWKFWEYSFRKSRNFHDGVKESFPVGTTFFIWFGRKAVHQSVLSVSEFSEIRYNESHTLFAHAKNCLPVLSTFVSPIAVQCGIKHCTYFGSRFVTAVEIRFIKAVLQVKVKVKVKYIPCIGTEALYRPCGP